MCHLLTHYLRSIPDSSIELRTFHRTWTRKTLWEDLTRIPTSHPPPPPSLDDTHPKQAAWNTFLNDYTHSDHPSTAACSPPVDSTPPPAISAAIAFGNRAISSTVFQIITGHCFDADYSDHFHPSANDVTHCPCARAPNPENPDPRTQGQNLSRRPLPRDAHHRPFPRHTRHHVLFRCRLYADSRAKHFHGVTNLTTILRLYDLTLALCAFLVETNSSLIRLLPVLRPGRDPPL
jgi:hypothetical protein